MTTISLTIVAYISGDGYGHAARTGLVLHALREMAPTARIVVRGTAPTWMYPSDASCARLTVDVGVIQIDSITPLIDETVSRAYAFELERPGLAASEAEALAGLDPTLIVGDIPPIAFDVAHRLGIPSIGIGNFGWDWIYRHIGSDRPEVDEIANRIAESEARCSLLLRLPLHDEMTAFPRREDAPLIAHMSRANRAQTRERILMCSPRATGPTRDRPLALLSFGGLGFQTLDLRQLANTPDVTFVLWSQATGEFPENALVCPEDVVPYPDLLAACDVVVMKPGYGTVADCLANRVPMVYATRPGFAEEGVLIPAMHELGRAAFISNQDLFGGNLGPAIEEALSATNPWSSVPNHGAEHVARRILDFATA